MCGIAGFCGELPVPAQARVILERMIHTLHHRGPDGYGFHVGSGIGLAHARLSIIDLVSGEQPIHNERQNVWTVFNGEIFNYVELRANLEQQGHRFYTRSDTEVIVHLYEQYGDAFVEHLNGQFAIALWDDERRRLLLTRDRAGIRPLFYTRATGNLWFGSEIKSLLAVLPQYATLDPLGLVQTFSYWGPVDPNTLFKGIHSLPPGHILAISDDGSETLTRYWDWNFPSLSEPASASRAYASVEDATVELRALLIDAVRLQLRADVPVGAYLSGGLDSSGIVALIRSFTETPVRTFSVAFDDAEFDESEHQAAMVRYLGTDHTTLHCSRRDIGEAFPQLIRHTETPILRTAAAPLMLLSRRVREEGYKVVLTGEGADEVFGGYDIFKEAKIRRFWAQQPTSTFRPKLLGRLYGYLDHSPVASEALAQAFFKRGLEHIDRPIFAHAPRWITSQRAVAFLSDELRASVGNWDPLTWYEKRLPADIMSWSPLSRDQYVEAKTLLAAYLLPAQGDRVAMANSVEGRFPYLDHRLIEFAARLPPSWKIRGLTEKYLLRRALAGLLPDEILKRTKQPYRAPDSQSFFFDGEPLDYVADLMGGARIRAAGYFNAAMVGRLFDKCRHNRAIGFADNQAFVGILSTMLLDESFLRRSGA
ncbi:asparagine synthase (glutamine-hydrolyzing) [Rhodanobacter sp. MP7CTX1]|uniref:asparagine synthase (glutamine-hydrolyzing) n=1 Tax=Rhodanobacter sp. MP7CTX1 TaxID=2723084 RepID=UPI00161952B4|nr:asparagine synthase (glutamine-hydrolyzing) [Rhodanobacter sp. MP7CTX1]MBB6188330.1 asparagine synthase (glutamine-hydrolyzing) [Rhodanobacter sp. MP7CTX1]